jgi:type II secretory pathway pseudopilin PulG
VLEHPSVISIAALQALVVIGVMVAIPSYGAYTYRSTASESVSLAGAAKVSLEEYLNEHRRLPARIEEVTDKVSGEYVDRLVLESDGTIRAIFGDKARKLSGHSVSFVPVIKDGRIVDWVCRDLPDRCLPSRCRRH